MLVRKIDLSQIFSTLACKDFFHSQLEIVDVFRDRCRAYFILKVTNIYFLAFNDGFIIFQNCALKIISRYFSLSDEFAVTCYKERHY